MKEEYRPGLVSPANHASRIDGQINRLKEMTETINNIQRRVERHARTLGFYDQPVEPTLSSSVPRPIISTLEDAILDLSHAIDHASGTLNVFD